KTNETTKKDEKALEETKKEPEAEEVSKNVKSSEVAAVQQQDTEGITINDTDSYLIGSGHILQLDGNDPSIEKGRVQLDNSSITNSLALGEMKLSFTHMQHSEYIKFNQMVLLILYQL